MFNFLLEFCELDELDRTAGSVVDVVQAVADGTEKMTSKLAEALPDGGKLEKLVLKVGDFAEEVGDRADLAEDIIDKVLPTFIASNFVFSSLIIQLRMLNFQYPG